MKLSFKNRGSLRPLSSRGWTSVVYISGGNLRPRRVFSSPAKSHSKLESFWHQNTFLVNEIHLWKVKVEFKVLKFSCKSPVEPSTKKFLFTMVNFIFPVNVSRKTTVLRLCQFRSTPKRESTTYVLTPTYFTSLWSSVSCLVLLIISDHPLLLILSLRFGH